MPTYEYACTSCRRHFDVQQSFSDPPLEVCEVCGGTLKRVFHPVGVVLKGSGFYATDNRSKSKSAPSSKDSDSKDTEKKPSETKPSDPKPDAKRESKKESTPDAGSTKKSDTSK